MLVPSNHLAGHSGLWTALCVADGLIGLWLLLFITLVLSQGRDGGTRPWSRSACLLALLIPLAMMGTSLVWWAFGLGRPIDGSAAQHLYNEDVANLADRYLVLSFVIIGVVNLIRVVRRAKRRRDWIGWAVALGVVTVVAMVAIRTRMPFN